jgi:hypothetical protein
MRLVPAVSALLIVNACDAPPRMGPPARLVAGVSDTVIVNSRRSVQIPVRALDAAGRPLPVTGVRYQWMDGARVAVSTTGTVTCTQPGDATLRASLGSIATSVLLRCRPVQKLHIPGPIQFVLGDTAQDMSIEAFDPDGHRVYLLAGTADIFDTTIASLDGLRLTPRSPGSTVASFRAGERSAGVGVHVYERVATLDGLRPEQGYVAMSLRLVSGEVRRWHLPAGEWMLTMLPYEDEARGLRLRIEGANCLPAPLTRRRYVCLAKNDASVIVYHPSTKSAPDLTGELLLRRVGR